MAQIRELIDQSQEAKTREQLEFLLTAAEGKLNYFQSELENMFLNPEAVGKIQIVGNRAMAYYQEYRANITTGVDEQIGEVVDDFFEGTGGSVKEGFVKLVKTGLKTILGSETAGEMTREFFFVVPENLAFIRVDIKCWRYNFSSEGIISNCKNAMCFVFCKSVVDHRKLTVDELIYFIASLVGNDIEAVKGYIEQMKELWKLIGDTDPELVAEQYRAQLGSVTAPVHVSR